MSKRNVVLLVLTFALVAAVPAFAGSSVVGSVAGSMNATISGQPAVEGSTVFSGDILKVTKDGAAIVTYGQAGRAVFGRDSEVSFSREGESITARLASGSVSIFQPGAEPNAIRLVFDNVTVSPAGGYKTLGEVAMLGDAVVVRTKEGAMNVNFGNGKTTQVPAGKAMRLVPQRAPQQAAGSQHFGGQANWVEYAALAAGGVAAVLAGVSISKADDATTAANSAGAAAASAGSAATAAASAAAAANSAAAAAGSAATAAANNANLVGCALNTAVNPYGMTGASPYTPPTGYSCGS